MQRKLFFLYGVLCHVMFLAVYAYMAGFVGNFLVPKSIDGVSKIPVAPAVLINMSLLVAFGIQHSLMARPTFKNWWTQFVPRPIERSTYVLVSNLLMIALFALWQPIDIIVWDVQGDLVRAIVWGLFAAGWLLVPAVSMLISHFDLFGTRQVWLRLKGKEYESLPFRVPSLYKRVRHPLYVGWIIAFWAIPTMTLGHLLFAGVLTAYILVAIWFEERNLVDHFGEKYVEYRKQVPMLVPRVGRAAEEKPAEPAVV